MGRFLAAAAHSLNEADGSGNWPACGRMLERNTEEGIRMARSDELREGVSEKTDELASALLGKALDVLAVGEELHVLLALGTEGGEIESLEFAEDGAEECLEGAHKKTAEAGPDVVRYALAYRGAIADETGAYQDAVILEFGERGYRSYSAFSLVDVTGDEDTFGWTAPEPAGEVEPLLA